MEKNKEMMKLKYAIEQASKLIETCSECGFYLNVEKIPIDCQPYFAKCNCINCPDCKVKGDKHFIDEYDEDRLYLGKKCKSCGKENVQELSELELNMMSED